MHISAVALLFVAGTAAAAAAVNDADAVVPLAEHAPTLRGAFGDARPVALDDSDRHDAPSVGTELLGRGDSTTDQAFLDSFDQVGSNLRGKNKEDGGREVSFLGQAALFQTETQGLLSGDDRQEPKHQPMLIDEFELLSSVTDKAWQAEMEEALRNLEDELELVRQASELEEVNEGKENELNANEKPSENYSFVEDEVDGLLKIVNEDCTSISITFHSINETEGAINFGGCEGYSPVTEEPTCDQDISTKDNEVNFPVTCTYRMEFHGKPGALTLITNQGGENEMEEQGLKKNGKHTKQQRWVAKAVKRISIGKSEGSCAPEGHGRELRGISCDLCWFVPCNCDCRGWTQHTFDCWKPCSHYNDEFTQTVGLYCFKPCDRKGQLALNVGCGFTPLDRTCHEDSMDCAMKLINHVLSIVEVLTFFLSAGVAGAFKSAVKVAGRAAAKVAAKTAIKTAIWKVAGEFALSLMRNKALQKIMRQTGKRLSKEVIKQGAELFVGSSMGTEPDFPAVADEIVEAVDPTGIYGLVKGLIPPESCDHSVFLGEDIPDEEAGLPDTGPLDDIDRPPTGN